MSAANEMAHRANARIKRPILRRTVLISGGLLIALFVASPVLAACDEPAIGTRTTPIFSPPLGSTVIGTGRLQFYSAPDKNCAINGVFVVPRDNLIAYAQTDSFWTYVTYFNGAARDVTGWVRSSRLKHAGTVGAK